MRNWERLEFQVKLLRYWMVCATACLVRQSISIRQIFNLIDGILEDAWVILSIESNLAAAVEGIVNFLGIGKS